MFGANPRTVGAELATVHLPWRLAFFEKETARWPRGILARQPDNCIGSLLDCPISGVVVEIRLRIARVGGIDLDPILRKVFGERHGDRIQCRLGAVIRENVHGVVGV